MQNAERKIKGGAIETAGKTDGCGCLQLIKNLVCIALFDTYLVYGFRYGCGCEVATK